MHFFVLSYLVICLW